MKIPAIRNQDKVLLEKLIQKDLGITLSSDTKTIDELLEQLEKAINQLLDHDFEKLLNTLYRIDVAEDQVKKILALEKVEDMVPRLAQLILHREIKKIQIRKSYQS